jgi:hypothetical protein
MAAGKLVATSTLFAAIEAADKATQLSAASQPPAHPPYPHIKENVTIAQLPPPACPKYTIRMSYIPKS